MSTYFEENTDKDRLRILLDVKMRYAHNEITLEEGRKELKEKLGKVSPLEVAATEQELLKFEEDQCQKEDIQAITILFEGLMDTSRPELPQNHPIMHYYRENDELREIILEIEDLVQYPLIKNQWYELYERLAQIKIHFARKQNQLYSVLEKKGFTRPTTTMWTLDDFIKDEVSSLRRLLESDEGEFIKQQATLIADMRDLMDKEEKILYPTSLSMISPEEFEEMKIGDREIGFAWIEVEQSEVKSVEKPVAAGGDFANELNALLSKYKMKTDSENLEVKTGNLSLEQINLIYQHMPVDFSFVDENEIVKFYTDTKHRVFPRSKNVIGRDVKNCHPRDSVHIVEEIIEKFRSKEQSEAEFWINKPGLFIYIKYIAIRDEQGEFRGVLEMMQDCTHIRSLEGSQTLLSWSGELERDIEKGEGDSEVQKEKGMDEKEENKSSANSDGISAPLTPDTKLKPLLEKYPDLKEELPKINPAFKMLHSPLARVLIPKATIQIMAERSSMDVGELIEKIEHYIKNRNI